MSRYSSIKHNNTHKMINISIIGCFLLNTALVDTVWALRPNATGHGRIDLEKSLSETEISKSTLFDKLYSRRDEGTRFKLAKDPGKEYALSVHEDFLARGILVMKGAPERHTLIVRTVSENEDGIMYPAGFMSGIDIDDNGTVKVEWLTTLDYEGIYRTLKPWVEPSRAPESIIPAMAWYTLRGANNQYQSQIKLLFIYLTSVLKMRKDADVERFFQNAPKNLREKGIGTAMQEFLGSFLPIGTRMKSLLANEESLSAMKQSKSIDNTLIGEWYSKMGYDIVDVVEEESNSMPTVILQRTKIVPFKTQWKDLSFLGKHRAETDKTSSAGSDNENALVLEQSVRDFNIEDYRAIMLPLAHRNEKDFYYEENSLNDILKRAKKAGKKLIVFIEWAGPVWPYGDISPSVIRGNPQRLEKLKEYFDKQADLAEKEELLFNISADKNQNVEFGKILKSKLKRWAWENRLNVISERPDFDNWIISIEEESLFTDLNNNLMEGKISVDVYLEEAERISLELVSVTDDRNLRVVKKAVDFFSDDKNKDKILLIPWGVDHFPIVQLLNQDEVSSVIYYTEEYLAKITTPMPVSKDAFLQNKGKNQDIYIRYAFFEEIENFLRLHNEEKSTSEITFLANQILKELTIEEMWSYLNSLITTDERENMVKFIKFLSSKIKQKSLREVLNIDSLMRTVTPVSQRHQDDHSVSKAMSSQA